MPKGSGIPTAITNQVSILLQYGTSLAVWHFVWRFIEHAKRTTKDDEVILIKLMGHPKP